MKMLSNLIGKYLKEELILIYTPGKVGSSSLEDSLPGSIHTHTLYDNPPNPPHWQLDYYTPFQKFKFKIKQFIRRRMIKHSKKIIIISVIREPISRNHSMFFQALPFWLAKASSNLSKDRMSPREEGFEFLHNAFQKNFNHLYICEWFDKEIKRFTGIDIYQHDETDKGFYQVRKGKIHLLVVKLEDLESNIHHIEYATGKKITISEKNTGSKKWYSEIYKKFKESFTLDTETLAKITNSNYYKKFYEKQ